MPPSHLCSLEGQALGKFHQHSVQRDQPQTTHLNVIIRVIVGEVSRLGGAIRAAVHGVVAVRDSDCQSQAGPRPDVRAEAAAPVEPTSPVSEPACESEAGTEALCE